MDEKFIYAYDHEAVRKKEENSIRRDSYEEGLELGLEQGITQEKLEIAKMMLKKELDIKTISECTGLSLAEINKLKEKEC